MATPSDEGTELELKANTIYYAITAAMEAGFLVEYDAAGALDLVDPKAGRRTPLIYARKRTDEY